MNRMYAVATYSVDCIRTNIKNAFHDEQIAFTTDAVESVVMYTSIHNNSIKWFRSRTTLLIDCNKKVPIGLDFPIRRVIIHRNESIANINIYQIIYLLGIHRCSIGIGCPTNADQYVTKV